MNKREMLKVVKNICNSIALSLNYELVDVEYVKEFGSFFLKIYIDKPGGVNLDDCQSMSELVSERLDAEDPIKDAYYLEVSSPGLDRPLKTDKDLRRNIGKDIEIKLYKAINNKKSYEGRLEDFNELDIILSMDNDNTINIPKEAISVIKLALKF